jgi:hypothetical protein
MPPLKNLGGYSGGKYIPDVHDNKALVGYDAVADEFYFIAADEDGALLCRQQVVDVETLEWVNATGGESTPTSKYIISDMDTSADPNYFGYVDKSGAWYIMKLSESTGEMRYAKGASGYAAAWAAKAAQSYDYFSATF